MSNPSSWNYLIVLKHCICLQVMTCRPRSDLYIDPPALRKLDNMVLVRLGLTSWTISSIFEFSSPSSEHTKLSRLPIVLRPPSVCGARKQQQDLRVTRFALIPDHRGGWSRTIWSMQRRENSSLTEPRLVICLKQSFPGLTQTTLDMSKIQCNKVWTISSLHAYAVQDFRIERHRMLLEIFRMWGNLIWRAIPGFRGALHSTLLQVSMISSMSTTWPGIRISSHRSPNKRHFSQESRSSILGACLKHSICYVLMRASCRLHYLVRWGERGRQSSSPERSYSWFWSEERLDWLFQWWVEGDEPWQWRCRS